MVESRWRGGLGGGGATEHGRCAGERRHGIYAWGKTRAAVGCWRALSFQVISCRAPTRLGTLAALGCSDRRLVLSLRNLPQPGEYTAFDCLTAEFTTTEQ